MWVSEGKYAVNLWIDSNNVLGSFDDQFLGYITLFCDGQEVLSIYDDDMQELIESGDLIPNDWLASIVKYWESTNN